MDITAGRRDDGIYTICTTGTQHWPEGSDTWAAHGVCLQLMDGPSLLAICRLEVPGAVDAEARGIAEAERIEPWVRTLRYLAVARTLRSRLNHAEQIAMQADRDGPHMPMLDYMKDELLALAEAGEVERAEVSGGLDPLGGPLARIISDRLRRQVATALKAALAFAPDTGTSPIHPAWELKPLAALPGESLEQAVARDLLVGWAAARDMRDPLVTWAVKGAGVTRSDVQETTGISRSTINRLLP